MRKVMFALAILAGVAGPASVAVAAVQVAPGVWALPNYGRNHGVVTGPGMPKCNPWVSDECRRLYPSLLKKVPQPR
jgi:hypothetical protein